MATNPATPPQRGQHSKSSADQREQECLGQKLAHQAASRYAERDANRKLAFAHRSLRQEQVRNVRARNKQQESYRAQQN
jgi:hypothetical protein